VATAFQMAEYGTSSYQTAPLQDYSQENQASHFVCFRGL
jgi:hypothetical protein